MDVWLQKHLVCPRTREPLDWREDHLLSPSGHRYPIVDGIPIMLVDEAEATNPVRFENTQQQLSDPLSVPPDPNLGADEIDPYIRDHIVSTCGNLYRSSRDMQRYPIPELQLPASDGQRFLDVGCGWGRWSIAAAQKGYRPVGIDPSLDRARVARRIARQFGVDTLFLVADARYLPFTDTSFDVVFSFSVLQNFSPDDLGLALAELRRVMTPESGICKIQMATRWGVRNLMNQLRQKFKKPHPFMMRYWPQRDLRHTFSNLVGPTDISVEGFFSVNAQMTDLDILPWRYRCVVRSSELMRRLSERARWLGRFADSVYVESRRAS